jgi:hypothetical protein
MRKLLTHKHVGAVIAATALVGGGAVITAGCQPTCPPGQVYIQSVPGHGRPLRRAPPVGERSNYAAVTKEGH